MGTGKRGVSPAKLQCMCRESSVLAQGNGVSTRTGNCYLGTPAGKLAPRALDFSGGKWVVRHSEALQPNWPRNHREKALRAENPSRSVIDARSRLPIYRAANSARTASIMDENVCPSRARCRCSFRRLNPNRFATVSIEQRPDGSMT